MQGRHICRLVPLGPNDYLRIKLGWTARNRETGQNKPREIDIAASECHPSPGCLPGFQIVLKATK